jgi:hypothetical protein
VWIWDFVGKSGFSGLMSKPLPWAKISWAIFSGGNRKTTGGDHVSRDQLSNPRW